MNVPHQTRHARLALILPIALIAAPLGAQTGEIIGTVTDSTTGMPVANAELFVVGTNHAGRTEADGRYRLARIAAGTYALDVRRIGYRTRRVTDVVVPAGGVATADIRLFASAFQLDEVVVTGIVDPTSGVNVPFTVARLDPEDTPVPTANAVEIIQGKIPGVSLVPEGQPGSGTNIVLRTPASITKSNFPLVVVDGVILNQTQTGTADLDGLDIERVEVVKGAAAASLYGSRAQSGVIQIWTKRGRDVAADRTRVTVRSEAGVNSLARSVEFARYHFFQLNSAGQYIDSLGNPTDRTGRVERAPSVRFQDGVYPDPVYDPIGSLFDPGGFVSNSVSLAHRNATTNLYASVGSHRSDGVVLDNGWYRRNDARLNIDHQLSGQLSASASVYYANSWRDELYDDAFFDFIFQPPDVNLLEPDPDGVPYVFQPDARVEENPLYVIHTEQELSNRARFLGSADIRWAPLAWLSLDANVSFDRTDANRSFFLDRGFKTEGFATGGLGEVEYDNRRITALNASISANVIRQFGPLTARTTLRSLLEQEENAFFRASGEDLVTRGVPDLTNARFTSVASSLQEIRATGFFVVAGFDYGNRYILDGLLRRDGSSLFGSLERWHTYTRMSAAWRLAQERWWRWPAVNELKLRFSRGTAGGRPEFADQYEALTVDPATGIEKNTLGNPFLKPERATETEFGLDAIVFNRLSVQFTRSTSRIEDQLLLVPLSAAYGFNAQWRNAGTLEGNTWEAAFEAEVLRRENKSLKLGFVFDRSRHEITSYDSNCLPVQTIAFRCPGVTLGGMFGYRWITSLSELPAIHADSLDQFQVNDDGMVVAVGPGGSYTDGLWNTTVTINGQPYSWGMPIQLKDSLGNSAVVRIGDSNADFSLGVSGQLRWGNLSAYALVGAQIGGNTYNRTKQRMYQWARSRDVDQAGKPDSLKKPAQYYALLYDGNNVNNHFVEPGGFVKLREVSIRYRLTPGQLRPFERLGVRGVSIAIIGRNLLTRTDYSGYDPEIGSATLRLDDFVYPRFRTITASAELEF